MNRSDNVASQNMREPNEWERNEDRWLKKTHRIVYNKRKAQNKINKTPTTHALSCAHETKNEQEEEEKNQP